MRKCFRLKRKPDENQAENLQRTAGLIKEWLARYGCKPIHVQALSRYYKAAFDEETSCTDNDLKYLLGSRVFRSRVIWEMSKNEVGKRRRLEGLLQRAQGVKTYWEDPLVHHMGLFRRGRRSSMTGLEWQRHSFDFIANCCHRWDLPLCSAVCNGKIQASSDHPISASSVTKDRLTFRGEQPEPDEVMDTVAPLIEWGSREQTARISFCRLC